MHSLVTWNNDIPPLQVAMRDGESPTQHQAQSSPQPMCVQSGPERLPLSLSGACFPKSLIFAAPGRGGGSTGRGGSPDTVGDRDQREARKQRKERDQERTEGNTKEKTRQGSPGSASLGAAELGQVNPLLHSSASALPSGPARAASTGAARVGRRTTSKMAPQTGMNNPPSARKHGQEV